MKIHGCFLCLGEQMEPQVQLLGILELQALNDRLRLASLRESERMRHEAYRLAFRAPVQYAIPCWSEEAMTELATKYIGAHQKQVRGLAACIVTGTPYGGGAAGGRRDDNGGQPALLDPVKPLPKTPGGAAVRPPANKKGATKATKQLAGVRS